VRTGMNPGGATCRRFWARSHFSLAWSFCFEQRAGL
jgi:hypothetical protein